MEHKGLKAPLTMEQMEKQYEGLGLENKMQNLTTVTKEELPLRSRFYQGMIDLASLESGMDYINLKESYVIFICTSDPFDRNLGCYSITNTRQEDISLPYNDKRTILFYNTKGNLDNISEEAKDFLNYIETKTVNGDFVKQLDNAVRNARHNKEWRAEYMHSLVHDRDMINKGKREGREEGSIVHIRTCRKMNISDDVILENLITEFELDKQSAITLMHKTIMNELP